MEKLKQTIYKLENEVSELRQFQTKLQGSLPAKGDIHYCTGAQEFGEYDLDEIDSFRFTVIPRPANYHSTSTQSSLKTYRYELINITSVIGSFTTDFIPVDIENFEKFIMKSGNLTEEKRKCLQSKVWNFAADISYHAGNHNGNLTIENTPELYKDLPKEFYEDITIPFTHTYTICPHVSFYITPLSNTLDECVIHEITTKQVVFRIKYGNYCKPANQFKRDTYSGLKLHYNINGIVDQKEIKNLLE